MNNTKKNAENVTEMREKSPTSVKDVILASSKNIIGKVLSPPKDNKVEENKKAESKKPMLMTRRELTDPFGSDEEDNPDIAIDNSVMNNKTNCDVLVNGDNSESGQAKDLPKPNPVS